MLKKIQTWIDNITTAVASILLLVMFLVLIANVVLRLIPSVGGFRWYMEFSQYANVWAMLIGAAGIAAQGTNLRVEAVDSVAEKIPGGKKIAQVIVDVALIAFYCVMFRSGQIISARAVQAVSTMPQFRMGQVYSIFPVAAVLCILGATVNLLVTLTEKNDDALESVEEKIAEEMEGKEAEHR